MKERSSIFWANEIAYLGIVKILNFSFNIFYNNSICFLKACTVEVFNHIKEPEIILQWTPIYLLSKFYNYNFSLNTLPHMYSSHYQSVSSYCFYDAILRMLQTSVHFTPKLYSMYVINSRSTFVYVIFLTTLFRFNLCKIICKYLKYTFDEIWHIYIYGNPLMQLRYWKSSSPTKVSSCYFEIHLCHYSLDNHWLCHYGLFYILWNFM